MSDTNNHSPNPSEPDGDRNCQPESASELEVVSSQGTRQPLGSEQSSSAPRSFADFRSDIAVLAKFRLNALVLVTTLFGYILARKGAPMEWWTLFHVVFGTALVAFGSAAINQLMEIEEDARMTRTANRPLPARRLPPIFAFAFGWLLTAFGIIHLAAKVNPANPQAAYLAAITLAIYVFVYTPLKRRSSTNTLVGAIPGAIPPVIGWLAGGQGYDLGALFLFGLLFFWQLPHFVAINWLCREEYESAGYVMWSNGDVSGRRTATLATAFSACLLGLTFIPFATGLAGWLYLIPALILACMMLSLALIFLQSPARESARRLFLFTLVYLPLAMMSLVIGWK